MDSIVHDVLTAMAGGVLGVYLWSVALRRGEGLAALGGQYGKAYHRSLGHNLFCLLVWTIILAEFWVGQWSNIGIVASVCVTLPLLAAIGVTINAINTPRIASH